MGVYEWRVFCFCACFNIVIRIIIYAFEELWVLRFWAWKYSLSGFLAYLFRELTGLVEVVLWFPTASDFLRPIFWLFHACEIIEALGIFSDWPGYIGALWDNFFFFIALGMCVFREEEVIRRIHFLGSSVGGWSYTDSAVQRANIGCQLDI